MTEGDGRLVAARYRLRQVLGRGGMGVVWRAHDEYLDREVAIKEIVPPRGRVIREDDPEVRRALREARAAAKLSKHPRVITVYDVVTDGGGLPVIVMELLHGRSLSDALAADGPMPLDRAARIGIEVLEALDYAHSNGVLHRDVKPGNVMLVDDQVVLTDFGIALIDGDSVLTATGQLPGVPEYISPERIRGEEALPAADLWSVGIMLYGMVVGRTPFSRGDVQATLGAVLSWEPAPDPKVGRLAPVIDGLLRKKPAERMTARNAIDRLTEIAAVPSPAPPGTRVRLEFPTKVVNPAGELTVAHGTVPNTRTAVPPFLPPPAPVRGVAPDAPTLPPAPWPRSNRGPLIAIGAAVVAVVAAVILANLPPGDRSAASQSSGQSPTPTAGAPDVTLKNYQERLGFEIGVPPDWRRASSIDGALSSVTWEGQRTDPKVGALKVEVQRRTGESGVSAIEVLEADARAQSTRQQTSDYREIELSGNASSANFECAYRAGGFHYRTRTRAVASGALFKLTFSLYAADQETLARHWAAAEPLIAEIRGSFRPVGS
ncbi:serine/threonine protein kinase [Saccharothrix coeruleofusca]|uniref:serine/threonine-protein kinase n=1 Tax=Saccharothrix coeruleofusca TaxID=33919 RepID=UPI001AE33AF2|nr:serine/threonine-protein kinase [Saccharothrix coeruleofusca]MBP2337306.1 serine/threonine protein kinase [Saccharothrix coeruleofusca]